MNLEQVNKLTDKELRIKVAKLAGLNPFIHNCVTGRDSINCPNYPEDLNAMHEVEEAMDEAKLRDRYSQTLYTVMQCRSAQQWNATAKQRCKAFILTMTNAAVEEHEVGRPPDTY